jgi:NAD(P)-dependent dehydrogenase (short-subunit alcohol dehydrogenase family)
MGKEHGMSGTVLITGTSSGIGRACAEEMARRGYRVLAGVRRPEDGEDVRALSPDRIEPIILDVTDLDAIAALPERVGGELAGLVNNAGMANAGPLEYLPVEEIKNQLDVMLLAPFALTKAMVPALRASRGRVVMIGSIGGRTSLPFMGPYNAAKAGVDGFANSLRQELRPFGVHVALVEPGAIKTRIWAKGIEAGEKLRESLPEQGRRDYGDRIANMRKAAEESDRRGVPPEKVAKAVTHALTADKPKTRYLVGPDARVQALLRAGLSDRALDRVLGRLSGVR